ncbi:MAG: hypothetical protein WC505_04610 [Patescibacteria group bacterium]
MADDKIKEPGVGAGTIDLRDPQWKTQAEAYVRWIVTFDELRDAYLFGKLLADSMKAIVNFDTEHRELAGFYRGKLALVRAVSLSMQPEDIFLGFFQDDICIALQHEDIDLLEKIDARVINEIILEDRDALKKKAHDRLVKNQRELTKNKITVGGELVPPTIENWLRHYNAAASADQSVRSLKQAEYLVRVKGEGLIDEHERLVLRRLIDVYEHLKLSSLSVEGIEENFSINQGGKKKIVADGRVEEVPVEQLKKKLERAIKIQKSVQGGSKQYSPEDITGEQRERYLEYRSAIMEKVEDLRAEAGNDTDKIKGIFARAYDIKDADEVTACLYHLAAEGELQGALVENRSWLDGTKKYAEDKFGSADAAEAVNKKPTGRESLSLFLQYALLDRLRFSQSESALIGMDVGALMGGQYQGMAYWDQEKGLFEWTELELRDGDITAKAAALEAAVLEPVAPAGSVSREAAGSEENAIDRLRHKYGAFRALRSVVLSIEDEVLVRTKGDPEALKRELSAAVREKNQDRAIACLKILAAQRTLAVSIKDSRAWVDALADHLREKYHAKNSPEEIERAIRAMRIDSSSPAVLSEFLQYILISKLGMQAADAALIASDIGQLIGSEYQAIAYGSEESGTFEWATNSIQNGVFAAQEG